MTIDDIRIKENAILIYNVVKNSINTSVEEYKEVYDNTINQTTASGDVIKVTKNGLKVNNVKIISTEIINYIANNTISSDKVKSVFSSNLVGDLTNEKFPETFYYNKEDNDDNNQDGNREDIYLLINENMYFLYELLYVIYLVKNISNEYIKLEEGEDKYKNNLEEKIQKYTEINTDEYKLKESNSKIEEALKSVLNIRKSNQDIVNYSLGLADAAADNLKAKLVNINNNDMSEAEVNSLKAIYAYANEAKQEVDFKEAISKMYNYFDAIARTAPSKIDSSGINQLLVDGMCFSTENLRSKINSSIFETMLRNKNRFNNPFINVNNFRAYDA